MRPVIVEVLGPDGSGKTSLSDAVREKLDEAGVVSRRAVMYARRTDSSLRKVELDNTKPHDKTGKSLPVSLVWIVAKFGYLLGQHVFVDRRPTQERTVVFRERGFLDYSVDHKRYGLHPKSIRFGRVLGRLFPRPSLALVLQGDPQKIRDRKPELSIEDLRTILDGWEEVSAWHAPNRVVIDTTVESIDGSAERTFEALEPLLDGKK